MFLDDLPAARRYDAVIVGAGPAGVSCAMALAAARRRVLIVESGGRQAVAGDHSVGYGHFSGGYWNQHWVRGLGGTISPSQRAVGRMVQPCTTSEAITTTKAMLK